MDGAPLCQHPQQAAATSAVSPVGWRRVSALAALAWPHPTAVPAIVACSAAGQVICAGVCLSWRRCQGGFARHMPRASPPPTITAAHCRERPMSHAAVWRACSVWTGPWW